MLLKLLKPAVRGMMAFVLLIWNTHAGAEETLEEKADLWGRMHGAAIHCHVDSAHDFGVAVVRYFQRQVGSGAQLENLKQIYGIKLIEYARITPSGKVGNGCGPFRKKYDQVFAMIKG